MTDETEPTEAEMQAEVDEMASEFNSLHHANTESAKVLVGRGTPLNPYVMSGKRMDFLIDAMFGPMGQTVERLHLELGWQRRLREHIAEALNETAGTLIVPNNGGPSGLRLP